MPLQTKYIWTTFTDPKGYDKVIKEMAGISDLDEIPIINYIRNFSKPVVVVSLGIGTGRELRWLNKIKNVSGIIGIDYSEPMLKFCGKHATKYKKRITLLKDDILNPVESKKKLLKIKKPIIYVCLHNTLGNFSPTERKIALRKVKNLLKEEDRLILCLYKILEKSVIDAFNLPPSLHVKSEKEKLKLAQLLEYPFLPQFWNPIIKKFQQLPRFWYDEKENDVAIYAGNKKVFISHRFSEEEIKKLAQIAKLKIEKLIEGKFMYVVMLKV